MKVVAAFFILSMLWMAWEIYHTPINDDDNENN